MPSSLQKAPGDLIRSADWNSIVAEVNQKVDLAGGETITGTVTIDVAQNIPTTPNVNSPAPLRIRNGPNHAVLIDSDEIHRVGGAFSINAVSSNGTPAEVRLATNGGGVQVGSTGNTADLTVSGAMTFPSGNDKTLMYHNTTASGNPTGDGFRLRYTTSVLGSFHDALVIEKTDGNHNPPDGGVVFVNTGDDGNEVVALVIRGNGRIGIGMTNPQHPMQFQQGALCDGQTWQDASRRELKRDIADLSPENSTEVLRDLTPVVFRYSEGDGRRRVGFIAEDVPELLASSDRGSVCAMDVVAVLTRVVQQQQEELSQLKAEVAQLRA